MTRLPIRCAVLKRENLWELINFLLHSSSSNIPRHCDVFILLDSDTFRAYNSLALASKARSGYISPLPKTRIRSRYKIVNCKARRCRLWRSILDHCHFNSKATLKPYSQQSWHRNRFRRHPVKNVIPKHFRRHFLYNGRSSLSRRHRSTSAHSCHRRQPNHIELRVVSHAIHYWSPSRYARTSVL